MSPIGRGFTARSCHIPAWTLAMLLGTGPALACNPDGFVVALDIGHTEESPGAISARGVPELQFNRELALDLAEALRLGGFHGTELINLDGRIGSLQARTRVAEELGASVLLSVHHDSVQPQYLERWTVDGVKRAYSDRYRGYSLFVSAQNRRYAESRRFGALLGEALRARGMEPTLHHAEPIPGEGRPLLDADLGLYRYDGLHVLRTATMPAVLFEAGVILHRDEELELRHPARRQKVAAALVSALHSFCGETTSANPVDGPDAEQMAIIAPEE